MIIPKSFKSYVYNCNKTGIASDGIKVCASNKCTYGEFCRYSISKLAGQNAKQSNILFKKVKLLCKIESIKRGANIKI